MMDIMGIMRIEWGFHADIMGILNRFKGQSRKPWFLHVFAITYQILIQKGNVVLGNIEEPAGYTMYHHSYLLV